MKLPERYEEQMQKLLGDEYPLYVDSLQSETASGLRINTKKIPTEEFEKIAPFPLEKIPWIPNGFYCNQKDGWSKHPYYYAGLYYLQEPSAMTPASRLPIERGDKVLDLCAAPGGKATQLGSMVGEEGLLVANDISNSRAKALLKNLELAGIGEILVTSEEPQKLVSAFREYFDKVLVDAPCSGEGMFHKEPQMMKFWETHGPEYYSEIQRKLLQCAYELLKPGGNLLFSTCTFSSLEDEGSIAFLLKEYPDMHLIEVAPYEGFSKGFSYEEYKMEECVRIFPYKMKGEGHFLALLQKEGQEDVSKEAKRKPGMTFEQLPEGAVSFLKQISVDFSKWQFKLQEGRVYALPNQISLPAKLRYLRTGLYLGEEKKNRFEPSQSLAMALKREEFARSISFKVDDIRVMKYLKGETISLEEEGTGWVLVCVEDFPLGWAKQQRNQLKNKYYPGWRLQ